MRIDVKTTIIRIAIAVSIIFNIAFISGYCYRTFLRKPGDMRFVKARVGRILRELHLSDEQRQEVRESMRTVFLEGADIKSKIKGCRVEMIQLLAASDPDTEAIEEKRQEIALLQEEVQKLVINNILEEKDILTPEQQKKLFGYLEERAKTGKRRRWLSSRRK